MYSQAVNQPVMGLPGFEEGTPLTAPLAIQEQWYPPSRLGVPEVGNSFGNILGE